MDFTIAGLRELGEKIGPLRVNAAAQGWFGLQFWIASSITASSLFL